MVELFTVAFFGHRYIKNPFRVEKVLYEQIRRILSEKEYVEFLVGRNGEFDQCVSSIVRKIKRENCDDNSSLVLMLPYLTAEYLNNEENFKKYYDSVEVSLRASKSHPKSAIQIRNREMVDRAELVICFVEKNYGGAYKTIEYAKKQGREIINIAKEELLT